MDVTAHWLFFNQLLRTILIIRYQSKLDQDFVMRSAYKAIDSPQAAPNNASQSSYFTLTTDVRMPASLLTIVGIITISLAVWGLLRGRIIAGSRGLKSNYYYRDDNPFSFYGFVLIYLSIGSFVLYQSLR